MTRLIAFLDESKKPVRDRSTGRVATGGDHYYVVAAAIVFASDLGDVRAQLSDIEAGLGYKLHYGDLSHKRRVEAIEAVEAIDGWDGYIFETARPLSSRHYTERHVRARLSSRLSFTCPPKVEWRRSYSRLARTRKAASMF